MLGNRLRKLREKEKLSQIALAKKLKMPNQNISNYERGFRTPDYETLQKFADYFGVSRAYLLGDTDDPNTYKIKEAVSEYKTPSNIEPIDPNDWTKIPIVGSIAAGEPITRIEHIEGYQFIPKKVIKNREAFALRVKGDSMSGDGIRDGHIVACIKTPEVTSNDIAVVAVGEDEATLKRVQQEGDICILIPSNPEMRPYTVKSKDVHIIGKAVMYTGYLE